MKYINAFIVAFVLVGCAQISPPESATGAVAGNWVSTIDAPCQRCTSAKWDRDNAPISLPRRAVVYSFTGEFAQSSYWWLINLDTGEITEQEAISKKSGDWTTTTKHLGTVEAGALDGLRASAARLWRSERFNLLGWLSPGTVEFDYIVSGSRQVTFSRFAPNDSYIVSAIDSALPADAPKHSGSFTIVRPVKNTKVP